MARAGMRTYNETKSKFLWVCEFDRALMQLDLSTEKNDYNIDEAARMLGITSSEIRSLLIRHVLDEVDGVRNLSTMRFRPADLIMLSQVAVPLTKIN